MEKWEGRGRWGRGGRTGEVRGGFKAVQGRGRGGDIGFQCKVVVQILSHCGIAKGEDFRWVVLGGEEKGGGVVVDFVVGGEVREGVGGEEVGERRGGGGGRGCRKI